MAKSGSGEKLTSLIYDRLKSEIESGRFTTKKLPSIKQLAVELDASFSTVREALDLLAQDGYVEMKHGVGTYVAGRPGNVWLSESVCLCMDISGHLFADLYHKLALGLQKIGILIFTVDCTVPGWEELLKRAARSHVSNIIFRGHAEFPYDIFKYRVFDNIGLINILGSEDIQNGRGFCRITLDSARAGEELLERFRQRGHKHILIVGTGQAFDDIEGCKRASFSIYPELSSWRDAGLTLSLLRMRTERSHDEFFDTAEIARIFNAPDAPTAVFGCRDYDLRLLQEKLIDMDPGRIEKLDWIGYGNTPHCKLAPKPFPSVDFNIAEIAMEAVNLIRAGKSPDNGLCLVSALVVEK